MVKWAPVLDTVATAPFLCEHLCRGHRYTRTQTRFSHVQVYDLNVFHILAFVVNDKGLLPTYFFFVFLQSRYWKAAVGATHCTCANPHRLKTREKSWLTSFSSHLSIGDATSKDNCLSIMSDATVTDNKDTSMVIRVVLSTVLKNRSKGTTVKGITSGFSPVGTSICLHFLNQLFFIQVFNYLSLIPLW